MCKATSEVSVWVEDLMDLKGMIEELEAEAEQITDKIKAFMGDEEIMISGNRKVTYREVASKRVDTTALKKLLGEEALAPYTKIIVSRRFSVQ